MATNRSANLTKRLSEQRITETPAYQELVEYSELLEERFDDMAATLLSLRSEDEGWSPINSLNKEDGFSLSNLKEIAEKAEKQTTGNPLLKRGLTLRTHNVFGRGIGFDGKVPERAQVILDKPANQAVLFSQQAFMHNERALFTTGNLIMAYRTSTQTFFPIPFSQITNSSSNPDLTQDVWFYQRTYTKTAIDGAPDNEPTVEWYPVLERYEDRKNSLPSKIGDHAVVPDVIIIDLKVNGRIGSAWGVPDCLPAMPYAWAHAEYLRDGSKLLKALATIAWKVTAKSKAGTANASARMANPKNAGSTASMTEGNDLVAMPKAGQVDLNDGSPIAGYVASALEVSKISLLSDPGTSGGSYGAAATLAPLEANAARARQRLVGDWYKRIHRVLKVTNVTPTWPRIAEDPAYRMMQSLSLAFTTGAIHQDEYRLAVLEALDVPKLHDEVPEPTEFTSASAFSDAAIKRDAMDAANSTNTDDSGGDPNARQGNSGAVAGGFGSSNDLRDGDSTPGTRS